MVEEGFEDLPPGGGIHSKYVIEVHLLTCTLLHRGAFCQFLFRWIYYCHSSKLAGKETDKTHLCVVVRTARQAPQSAGLRCTLAEQVYHYIRVAKNILP